MRSLLAFVGAALLTAACGRPAVLAGEDGKAWDGHLVVGQTVTFSAEIIDKASIELDAVPATRVAVDDPTIVTLGRGMYGYTLQGLAPGKTTLHVFAPGDTEPSDTDVVVE